MAYVQDFTKNQQNFDLAKSLLNQSMQPIQGANAATTLGKILTAYFATKGMRGSQNASEQAAQEKKDSRKMDLANAMSALREDTPYQPSTDETFDETDKLPPGLKNQGTGNNYQAMIQSLMGADSPELQNFGLKSLASQSVGTKDSRPSSVVEYEYLTGLPQDQQDAFLNMKRGGKRLIEIDRGNRIDLVDPTTSELVRSIDKQVPTEKTPQFAADVVKAKVKADADAKDEVNAPLKDKQDQLKTTSINQTLDTIESALDKTGFWTSGFLGKVSSIIPGSGSYSLNRTVDTIKANLAFDSLTKMREASPTGGALGSVSERELNLLESAVANLDLGLPEDELTSNLRKVHKHYTGWKATVEGINPDNFGEFVDGLGYEVFDENKKLIGYYD